MTVEFDPEVHCYECGSAEKWEHAELFGGPQNCKRCLVKNGGCHGVMIDFDRLVEAVGLEKAKGVLAAGVPTSGVVY